LIGRTNRPPAVGSSGKAGIPGSVAAASSVPVRWRKTRLSIRLVILRLLEMHTTSRVMQPIPQPFLIARDGEGLYY
jgi:hypothetical protein